MIAVDVVGNPAAMQREWQSAIERLLSSASEWAAARGWSTHASQVELVEEHLGRYSVPCLTIETPQGQLMLEAKARLVYGGDGRVDLYAWPTLHRVMLIRRNGSWTVRTDSGIDWPEPWSRETFYHLAEGLLKPE